MAVNHPIEGNQGVDISSGLGLLRLAFAWLLKGEVAYRIEIWRLGTTIDAESGSESDMESLSLYEPESMSSLTQRSLDTDTFNSTGAAGGLLSRALNIANDATGLQNDSDDPYLNAPGSP